MMRLGPDHLQAAFPAPLRWFRMQRNSHEHTNKSSQFQDAAATAVCPGGRHNCGSGGTPDTRDANWAARELLTAGPQGVASGRQ